MCSKFKSAMLKFLCAMTDDTTMRCKQRLHCTTSFSDGDDDGAHKNTIRHHLTQQQSLSLPLSICSSVFHWFFFSIDHIHREAHARAHTHVPIHTHIPPPIQRFCTYGFLMSVYIYVYICVCVSTRAHTNTSPSHARNPTRGTWVPLSHYERADVA